MQVGEIWKHQNLRVAYIAQHSMHHLEENQTRTPVTYIQDRFFQASRRLVQDYWIYGNDWVAGLIIVTESYNFRDETESWPRW